MEKRKKELNITANTLWEFLQKLLNDSRKRFLEYIEWKNEEEGIFKIVDPRGVASLWGIQKSIPQMNYDKMSRALRYYYKTNRLRKVFGQRLCFQFIYSSLNPPQPVTQTHFLQNLGIVQTSLDLLGPNPQLLGYDVSSFQTEAVYTNEID